MERMLARLTAGDRRRQSSDAALAARAEQLSRRYLGGHARPTSVRWVSTMGRRWASCTPGRGHHPGLRPAARRARPRARLRAAPRARPPARARPRPGLLAPARVVPAPGAGPGLPRRAGPRRGPAARGGRGRRPGRRRVSRVPGRRRASDTSGASSAAVPSGSASTGHHRTSCDSALTRARAPAGRHGGVAQVEVLAAGAEGPHEPVPVELHRAGGAARGCRCRTPRGPRAGPPPTPRSPRSRGARRTGTRRSPGGAGSAAPAHRCGRARRRMP